MKIAIATLREDIIRILGAKYTPSEASLVADVILYGEMSGHRSHGLLRLLPNTYGVFVDHPTTIPTYTRKTPFATSIDGGGHAGMLIGSLAMKELIDMMNRQGIGIVGTRKSFHTSGALSYYGYHLAKKGYISLIFANSSPFVAPFSAKKSLFGTNPFCIAIPSKPYPFLFDMSTAATTFGTIAEHRLSNTPLPPNVAISKEGNDTTDPNEALSGSLLPFDATYKGSGIAMIVEILGGVITGAGFAGIHKEDGWGSLFISFSPSLLGDENTLILRMQEFISTLIQTPTRDGSPIRIPGKKTMEQYARAEKEGTVSIDDHTWERIQSTYPS